MARQLKSLQDVQSYLGAAKETAAPKKQVIYGPAAAEKHIKTISRILGGEKPFFAPTKSATIVSWWSISMTAKMKEKLDNTGISYSTINNKLKILVSPKYKFPLKDLSNQDIKKRMNVLKRKSTDVQEYIKLAKILSDQYD